MGNCSVFELARLGYDTVVRPSSLVAARSRDYTGTFHQQLREFFSLTVVYAVSLFLYAAPLTYAGFGGEDAPDTVPGAVDRLATAAGTDPEVTWLYTISLAENCAFLVAASVVTLVAFHGAMIATRSSRGFLQSVRVITYSTGVYLAIIFSFAWYLSISDQIVVADEWLIALQVEFIYQVMDLSGLAYEIPGPRLADIETARMERTGKLVIAGLFLSGCYYLYSLYLGARITHRSGRFASVVAVIIMAVTPVIYALGFVLALAVADLDSILMVIV